METEVYDPKRQFYKLVSDQGSAELTAQLSTRTLAAIDSIEGVGKSGTNTFHKYKFATDADVLRVARIALAQNQIHLEPVASFSTQTPTGKKSQTGREEIHTKVEVFWRITDAVTGFTRWLYSGGEALDNEDKGINKATTQARKYFLLNYLQIPTDADSDAGDEAPVKAPARQPKPERLSPEADFLKAVDMPKPRQKEYLDACHTKPGGWTGVTQLAMKLEKSPAKWTTDRLIEFARAVQEEQK